MASKKAKIRIAANGYRLCDPLPKGEVLKDVTKKEWILGSPIGCGGFGDIYSCRRKGDQKDEYVIKLDNKDGPLFQEMNFYLRVAKEEEIKKFMDRHRIKFLGMPRYIGSGIHDKSNNRESNQTTIKKNAPTLHYRFLVMQRFGDQLEDWVRDKRLKTADAIDVTVKMIDVLQYIHSFGYIHGDIKGTNILKTRKASKDWFLVDFGLAERYCHQNGCHREEKPDKKRANNGTVEFRSRDANVGLLSRRSDIECLGYNLIQWLYGTLPWMSSLKDPKKVEKMKEDFFANLDQSLRKCFKKSVPIGLKEFFKFVDNMEYDSEPNYSKLKDILLKKLKKTDDNDSGVEEEEVLRKESQSASASESTVDTMRMNSPKRRPKNKRKSSEIYVELSDSEDSVVVANSPPKRDLRNLRNTPRSARNGVNASEITSPNRRSNRRPVPRFSTPLLFATDDEEDSPYEPEEVPSDNVFDLNISGDSKSDFKTVMTPAMKAVMEEIKHRRKLKDELKKKKKK